MHHSMMLIISRIDVSAGSQQRLHERHIAVHDGKVQRREPVGVARVGQRGRRHQHAVGARGARGLARAGAARRAVVQRATQPAVTDAHWCCLRRVLVKIVP